MNLKYSKFETKIRSISNLLEPLRLPILPEIVVVRDSGQIAGNLEPHAALVLMVKTSTCANLCFVLFSRYLDARQAANVTAQSSLEKLSVSSVLFGSTL